MNSEFKFIRQFTLHYARNNSNAVISQAKPSQEGFKPENTRFVLLLTGERIQIPNVERTPQEQIDHTQAAITDWQSRC